MLGGVRVGVFGGVCVRRRMEALTFSLLKSRSNAVMGTSI